MYKFRVGCTTGWGRRTHTCTCAMYTRTHTLRPRPRPLQDHFAKYEPTILELKKKYEAAMKEKMMVSLERDRLAARTEQLEAAGRGGIGEGRGGGGEAGPGSAWAQGVGRGGGRGGEGGPGRCSMRGRELRLPHEVQAAHKGGPAWLVWGVVVGTGEGGPGAA